MAGVAKKEGWFSRKHETNEAHNTAVATYQEEHGKEARRHGAQERKEARTKHTPQEQLHILDERLGIGKGAERERGRLSKLI